MRNPVQLLMLFVWSVVLGALCGCGQDLPLRPAYELAQACVSLHDPQQYVALAV